MLVKRYQTESVEKALAQAMKELGPGTVLVSSREVRGKGLRQKFGKPVYEVMVAYDPEKMPSTNTEATVSADVPHKEPETTEVKVAPVKRAASTEDPILPKAAPETEQKPVTEAAAEEKTVTLPEEKSETESKTTPVGQNPASVAVPTADSGIPVISDAIPEEAAVLDQVASVKLEASNPKTVIVKPEKKEEAKPVGIPVDAVRKTQTEGAVRPKIEKHIHSLDTVLGRLLDKFSFDAEDNTQIPAAEPEEMPHIERLFLDLVDAGLKEALAHTLIAESQEIISARTMEEAKARLQQRLHAVHGTLSPMPMKALDGRRIVMVLGPAGAGKTTALVKLAAEYAVTEKKKIGIINTDTHRIAGHEQLKAYADILAVPYTVAYAPEEVAQAVKEMADCELIFIDPPGTGLGEALHQDEIMEMISLVHPTDIFVCFPVTASVSSAREMMEIYRFLPEYRLILTKLDETKDWSLIFNLSWSEKKKIAYLLSMQNASDRVGTIQMEHAIEKLIGS